MILYFLNNANPTHHRNMKTPSNEFFEKCADKLNIDWIEITDQNEPPDQEVWIKDEFGKEGVGHPCYYTFTIKGKGKNQKIEYTNPFWDGEWMIRSRSLRHEDFGKITHFAIK